MWIAALLLVVLAFYLGISWFFFRYACYRDAKITLGDFPFEQYKELFQQGKQWYEQHNPKTVFIQSHDGLRLCGHYIANGDSQKTILLMHGYRAQNGGISDFSIILPCYYSLGFNLLIADQRAHAASEGKYITFGAKERCDCANWVRYIIDSYGKNTKIVLDGISMGAATVLMACGLSLPSNVCGVVADCGFTSPYEHLKHVAVNKMHLPAVLLIYGIDLFARLFAKFSLFECSTLTALKNCDIPILFIHGTEDNFVPTEMSRQNAKIHKGKSCLVLVEKAGHAMSYLTEPERCQTELKNFMKSIGC